MLPDNDRMRQAEMACTKCIELMEAMVPEVALARQIVGLRDDRMQKEESVLVAEFLRGGDSAAAAKPKAQADPRFTVAMKKIMSETAAAQQSLLRYELEKLKYDNAQALRNDERARLRIL